ncbi:MAG: phospholipid carrier-dependent glycosyltransferase [Chloroflexota bacterium]
MGIRPLPSLAKQREPTSPNPVSLSPDKHLFDIDAGRRRLSSCTTDVGACCEAVAFFLLLLEPNLMAHGHYVTNDLAITLFGFLTTYLLWRLWQQRTWHWWAWLQVVLGIGVTLSSKGIGRYFSPHLGHLLVTAMGYAREKSGAATAATDKAPACCPCC